MPTKPTLPKSPRPPDLRYVKNEATKALRVQQHKVALAAYGTLKAQYDEELYPAYHAEQMRILKARQRERDGRQPRGPPPVVVGVDPLADAAVPKEVLSLVQRMCDHFGWMDNTKLFSLLDELALRQAKVPSDYIDPLNSKPWFENLPEALRSVSLRSAACTEDMRSTFHHTVSLALRIVRRKRKEAGQPLPDQKNKIKKHDTMEQRAERLANTPMVFKRCRRGKSWEWCWRYDHAA